MSYQLTFGGGEPLLVRNKGNANAVKGFVSKETVVSKNVTALATTFIFSLYEYVSLKLVASNVTIAWVKVAGIWKQAVVWIKVSGTWKTATPYIKVSGTWK
jgi:hypothetical protein